MDNYVRSVLICKLNGALPMRVAFLLYTFTYAFGGKTIRHGAMGHVIIPTRDAAREGVGCLQWRAVHEANLHQEQRGPTPFRQGRFCPHPARQSRLRPNTFAFVTGNKVGN